MKQMRISEHDRVRQYFDQADLGISRESRKLLSFLLNATIGGRRLHAKEVAIEFDLVQAPTDDDDLHVRNRISDLRFRLEFHYSGSGKADRIKLAIPRNSDGQGYRVEWAFSDRSINGGTTEPKKDPEQILATTLSESGLVNAFRIKAQNTDRGRRVADLVRDERKLQNPHFRLAASSGFSYINSLGPVWQSGLGDAVHDEGARLDVVLESPFSDFAVCRGLANEDSKHHWETKVNRQGVQELAELPNVSVRVTELPVNCSLFLTSSNVFYDPYLWARPSRAHATENNFWVFEFRAVDGPLDCYEYLLGHYNFIWENSIPFKDFLSKKPSFERRSDLFREKVSMLLKKSQSNLASGRGKHK